jgi:hypothetical protein
MGEKRNVYRILVGKPEGKRLLGRPQHRWVNNIKMYFREIGWGGMDSINLAEDRKQWEGSYEHGDGTSGYINFWESTE